MHDNEAKAVRLYRVTVITDDDNYMLLHKIRRQSGLPECAITTSLDNNSHTITAQFDYIGLAWMREGRERMRRCAHRAASLKRVTIGMFSQQIDA